MGSLVQMQGLARPKVRIEQALRQTLDTTADYLHLL